MKRILLILIPIISVTFVGCNNEPIANASVPVTAYNTNIAVKQNSQSTISGNVYSNSAAQNESSNKQSLRNQLTAEKNTTASDDSKFNEKLNKVNSLMETQKQKTFMLIIAQSDLEEYTWGGQSEFPKIWENAYWKYGYKGKSVMYALQSDLDTYLATGSSEYELLWATADLTYEAYRTGKLQEKMSAEEYQKLRDNLNAISKRLGIIYAKKEYVPQ